MVKPIPPSNPTPIILYQFTPAGSFENFAQTTIRQANPIPIGLPNNKPERIPNDMGSANRVCQSEDIVTAVFAKAKTGNIRKVTGKCNLCITTKEGERPSVLPAKGITIANNTPEIVACTPDNSMKYHITAPPIK